MLAMFLVETADAGVVAALEAVLRSLGFDVRIAGEEQPSIELNYQAATFAVFAILGGATRPAWPPAPGDGRRVRPPGAYAVIMSGVPSARGAPDAVGSIEIDARGDWLARVVACLAAMGWTA
jgi:hypothetical protein